MFFLFSSCFPNLGLLIVKKSISFNVFQTNFNWIFFSNQWVDSFLHSYLNLSFYMGLCKTSFASCVDSRRDRIELGADSKCGTEEEGEKLKVKVLVK